MKLTDTRCNTAFNIFRKGGGGGGGGGVTNEQKYDYIICERSHML